MTLLCLCKVFHAMLLVVVGASIAASSQPPPLIIARSSQSQVTGFLPTGNVLIAVNSLDKERENRIKPLPGSIRGEIVTSGYYGRYEYCRLLLPAFGWGCCKGEGCCGGWG